MNIQDTQAKVDAIAGLYQLFLGGDPSRIHDVLADHYEQLPPQTPDTEPGVENFMQGFMEGMGSFPILRAKSPTYWSTATTSSSAASTPPLTPVKHGGFPQLVPRSTSTPPISTTYKMERSSRRGTSRTS